MRQARHVVTGLTAVGVLAATLGTSAQAPAPVTATRVPCGPCETNTPTSEKRDAGCLNFCQPARCGTGKLTAVMTSPSASAVSYRPLKKPSPGNVRLLVWIVAFKASTAAG